MSKKIVLTSCGIIQKELKEDFFKLLNKEVDKLKVLYITTAVDGETNLDTKWLDREYKTILNLGIIKENIKEYKMDYDIYRFTIDMSQ